MIGERLADVRRIISDTAVAAGRNPDAIRIIAVTKTHPRSTVDACREAGVNAFGENRVQEAVTKYSDIAAEVELHLVGHLQSNKARLVPGLFTHVDSIDSLDIATALSRRCEGAGVACRILLQFNSSGEETKSGYATEQLLLDDASAIAALPGVRLRGVMTIGPFTADVERIRGAFRRTRMLFDDLRALLPSESIDTLSMGMSDDYRLAVEEGATEVRLGTALFGQRGSPANTDDSGEVHP
jgi:hypothetical protein